MVKRPKTPETDVTGKLLIIFKPYPNADCLVEEDKIMLARWVAEVINKDHIVTIWNRPNTQSLIMVEVLKETEHKSFLGEHRWAEFLKNPRPDEIDNVSQVFYSSYPNDREAQKKGWKQVDVQEFWFEGFRRGQGAIKQPYPETRWCEVPPNTSHVTAGSFCRPLPVAVKPPPPPVKPPVPGSEEYASARGLPTPTTTAFAESSSGPSTAPGTPLAAVPPPLPESWPAIGNQPATKKVAPKLTTANSNASAGNSAGGKNKGVKVGLAEFTTTKKPAGPSSWNKLTPLGTPKSRGPIASKDPPPSVNPPKERINAWGAPGIKATNSSNGPSTASLQFNKLTVSSSQSEAVTSPTTDQAPKKPGWGDMPSKPYTSHKLGEQAKVDDDAPHWSSVKSRQHNGNSKAESTEAPKLKWSEYEDDELPELTTETNEETQDDYDPWAAPSEQAASAPKSPAPSPPPAKPSTIPQSQVYEELWGDDAVDSGGGAWITKGASRGKRGNGRGNNSFASNDRDRDGGWGGGDNGGGRPWAPKSGPDGRGTTWNRGRGRGRGAKPMFESRNQRNEPWGNKGKQRALEVDEEPQDSEAQRNGGNSGSSGRSSPGPAAQGQWVADAPPHTQSRAEGSSTGLGAAFSQSSEDAYDHTAYWSGVEPISETTEDVYASFANAPPVANGVRGPSPVPRAPVTPASPTKKRTPAELQEEFDRLYKEHRATEKRRIEQIICTTHLIVCKKGVCKDIAKIWRVEEGRIDEKFKPPPHLRNLLKGKGGRRQGWNRGDYGGQRRAQQNSEVAEGDDRQQPNGRAKVKAVDGYQIEPSAADW